MSQQQRNIIQLRPRATEANTVCKQLRGAGYKQRSGQKDNTTNQPQQSSANPTDNTLSPLSRALKDFCNSPNPELRQKALKHISYATHFPQNHSEIFASGALYQLVNCLDSPTLANRSLSCLSLTNLALNGI